MNAGVAFTGLRIKPSRGGPRSDEVLALLDLVTQKPGPVSQPSRWRTGTLCRLASSSARSALTSSRDPARTGRVVLRGSGGPERPAAKWGGPVGGRAPDATRPLRRDFRVHLLRTG